jgi:hypothetical protein
MIYFVASANAQEGKAQEFLQTGLKLAAYANENFSEWEVQILRNTTGYTNQFHWVAALESLAALEEVLGKIRQDSGYQEILAELRAFFVESSYVVQLYEVC